MRENKTRAKISTLKVVYVDESPRGRQNQHGKKDHTPEFSLRSNIDCQGDTWVLHCLTSLPRE